MLPGHLSRQHLSWRHLSISGISQLLLIRFSPNFKGKIFGPCLKDANCNGDICPGNICHGDICPNEQYWNFQIQMFLDPKFFQT